MSIPQQVALKDPAHQLVAQRVLSSQGTAISVSNLGGKIVNPARYKPQQSDQGRLQLQTQLGKGIHNQEPVSHMTMWTPFQKHFRCEIVQEPFRRRYLLLMH